MKLFIVFLFCVVLSYNNLVLSFPCGMDLKNTYKNQSYYYFKTAEVACLPYNSIAVTFPLIEFNNFTTIATGKFWNQQVGPQQNEFSQWVVGKCDNEITQYRVGFFENNKTIYIQNTNQSNYCEISTIFPFTMIWVETVHQEYCLNK
ncbi:hypothetical protein ACTFIZ_003518 [Dictyostelium cf. discoideum]